MKKLLTFMVFFVAVLSLAFAGKNTLIKSTAEFNTAFDSFVDGDTITVAYNKGVIYNASTRNMRSTGGRITIRAQYSNPDSVPILQVSFNMTKLASNLTCGWVFEYMHLQYKNPTATSGQIIYCNKDWCNVDSVIFRHCVISNSVRSLIRTVVPVDSASCGDLNYLEFSDCIVHNTFSKNNNYPLLYLSHLPIEVVIKNNTFYDLPYMKNVFAMAYAKPDQGRTASVEFSNNTVCVSGPTAALVNTGSYLGAETQFTFKNNLILTPNWTNDLNVNIADSSYFPPRILSAKFGLVSASNNVVQGYNRWEAGQVIDSDGEGAFISLDTIPQYKMADLGVSWSDFTDPQNGNYTYLSTNPLATAGTDGAPIGDPRWVKTLISPTSLVCSSNVENAVVTPAKGVYESGASVTVSASSVVGYTFACWKDSIGNVVSTNNPYTFNITSNTKLVAFYDALQTRTVTVAIAGSSTATYSVSPVQTTYYVGNVVTTTLNAHAVNDFLGWSDGKTGMTRVDTLVNDLTLTASFLEKPYVMAWDFDNITANNMTFSSLANSHFRDSTYLTTIKYIGGDTLVTNFGTRNNKLGTNINTCIIRKTPAKNFSHPDYVFAKINTKKLTGVKITSLMGSDNCIYRVQKLEYSLNGKDYTTFASDTIKAEGEAAIGSWFTVDGVLPIEAEKKDSVFVRWIADSTSTRAYVSTSDQSYEYAYIAKIVVTGFDVADGTSWRVNPLLTYTTGQVISSVPGIKLTLGGGTNVWTKIDTTFTFGSATYVSSLNGSLNPTTADNKKFSASGIPPTVGAFHKFDVTAAGSLTAAVIINVNKASYIVDNTTAITDASQNITPGFILTVKTYAPYTIRVAEGHSYYFFSEASKMGILGFVYTPDSPVGIKGLKTTENTVYTSGTSLFIHSVKMGTAVIYNMLGKQILTSKLNEGNNEISGLAKGMYIVRMENETIKAVL
jgi:hypothetical protein